jgi:hypothetical protein
MRIDLPDDLPANWETLFKGLALLSHHQNNENYPFNCSHDTLTVMADPSKFTTEELELLDEYGFSPDDEGLCFTSFRWGSA